MTKASTPAAPAVPEVPQKPFSIKVGAPAHAAFNEAVVHARNGYCFSDGPIEIMPNGYAFFTMVIGQPNESAIQNAKASAELSVKEEAAKYKKDVEQAAKRLMEEQKRAELEKEVANATAALEKKIADLKKAAEAELAKLQ